MKCVRCGAETRVHPDARCHKCGHPVAFDTRGPLFYDGMDDPTFKEAVDRAGCDAGMFFTARHLWYQLNAGRHERTPLRKRRGPLVRFEVFQRCLARWIEVNGPVPGLLPPREVAAAAMPREVPADVASFSFDRAVVTDLWETAAMLVANRFHFEHNCAVLSVDGYPDHTAPTVMKMLRRNPRLTVFALHDATSAGCTLPLELRKPEWFPDWRTRVVDLGLRPEAAERLKVPWIYSGYFEIPVGLGRVLARHEAEWLRTRAAELAALPPATLLRGVYRGVVRAGPNDMLAAESGWGGVVWGGDLGGARDTDAAADTAAVDGFG